MSQMLPEGGEVMRRVACGDVCPAPPPPPAPLAAGAARSENKELLRQQLLSASKDRLNAEKAEPPKPKPSRNRQKNRWKLKFHHQALPQEYLDHYERSLQRASARPAAQQKTAKPDKHKAEPAAAIATAAADGAAADGAAADDAPSPRPGAPAARAGAPGPPAADERRKRSPAIAPSKVVTYDDLPYMGEMTLNDSKPRRGRKPKKADICHLIYENYGTVVPGRPPPAPAPRAPAPPAPAPRRAPAAARTDLQNRIISSLLERKLALRGRRARLEPPDAPRPPAPPTRAGPLHSDDEPLNLCVRDLRDLKLQIQRKFGNIYAAPEVKAEPAGPEQPNAISVIRRNTNPPPGEPPEPEPSGASPAPPEPGWPAPLYLHPLALHTQLLYYQRLAAAARLSPGGSPAPPSPPSPPAEPAAEPESKLVLKRITELLEPRAAGGAGRGGGRAAARGGGVKRKRSAIFIPPIPTRTNPTTPTAEVSICKFKFTGGSKPSLQEKKMLSVDSGGNFRYYSGTGAKGNKGYEYLRRDADQRRQDASAAAAAPPPAPDDDGGKRRRKSRKSLQREKLERTFKEKGFLIQTQQLQSAEGATYCKFRQLRKFTRYLFRSWKDYLPGELGERPAPELPPEPPGSPAGEDWG